MSRRHSFEKLLEQYYQEIAEIDMFDGVNGDEYQRAERRAIKRFRKMKKYYPESAEELELGILYFDSFGPKEP